MALGHLERWEGGGNVAFCHFVGSRYRDRAHRGPSRTKTLPCGARRELERERHDQEARLKAQSDEKRRFILVCIDLVDEGIKALQGEIARMQPYIESYVGWRHADGVPHLVAPMLSSLRALQSVW